MSLKNHHHILFGIVILPIVGSALLLQACGPASKPLVQTSIFDQLESLSVAVPRGIPLPPKRPKDFGCSDMKALIVQPHVRWSI